MFRFALVLCLLGTTTALAEQASGQFAVGITITGSKRGSLPMGPETVAVNSKAAPVAPPSADTIRDSNWTVYCLSRYGSFDPQTGAYIDGDGHRHYCQ